MYFAMFEDNPLRVYTHQNFSQVDDGGLPADHKSGDIARSQGNCVGDIYDGLFGDAVDH